MNSSRAFMNKYFYDRTVIDDDDGGGLDNVSESTMCYERWARRFAAKATQQPPSDVADAELPAATTPPKNFYDQFANDTTIIIADSDWMLSLEANIQGADNNIGCSLGCCRDLGVKHDKGDYYNCYLHKRQWFFIYDFNVLDAVVHQFRQKVPIYDVGFQTMIFIHYKAWYRDTLRKIFQGDPNPFRASLLLLSSPRSELNHRATISKRKRSCSPQRSRKTPAAVSATIEKCTDTAVAVEKSSDDADMHLWVTKIIKLLFNTSSDDKCPINVLCTGFVNHAHEIAYVITLLKLCAVKNITCERRRICIEDDGIREESQVKQMCLATFTMIAHISRNYPTKTGYLYFTADSDRYIPLFRDDDANAGIDVCFSLQQLSGKMYYTMHHLMPLDFFNCSGIQAGYYVQIASRSSTRAIVNGGGVGDANYLFRRYFLDLQYLGEKLIANIFPDIALKQAYIPDKAWKKPYFQAVVIATPDGGGAMLRTMQGWAPYCTSR
jgi:hypothetical protein